MSQPALTSFFGNTKRSSSRASVKNSKLILDSVGQSREPPPKKEPKKAVINKGITVVEDVVIRDDAEIGTKLIDKENKPVKCRQTSVRNVVKEIPETEDVPEPSSCPSPVKRTRRSSKSQADVEVVASKPAARGRRAVKSKLEEVVAEEKEMPASPSKKQKTQGTRNVEEAISAAREMGKKLTPQEMKAKLTGMKGRNKLKLLREQLATIQQEAKSVEEVRKEQEVLAKAKEAKELAAKEKEERLAAPAYQRFHSLAQKDDGSLPLPYTFKFLEEVFRCTEVIGSMLHNRQELITMKKLKKAVQQMLRKNFEVDYLKQIKTVFPSAYKFAWEHVLGRYGKKLQEFELHISVNMNWKIGLLESEGCTDLKEEIVIGQASRLAPQGMVERRNVFHSSLISRVKAEHTEFCRGLGITLDDEKLVKFHKDFNLDTCVEVPGSEFPPMPEVEKYCSAAEVLEKARDLFEVNPKLSAVLTEVAGTQSTSSSAAPSADDPKPVPEEPIKKAPLTLLERIRAKEAEKKSREMYTNKDEQEKMRRLQRLPNIARHVKSIFISEGKNALRQTWVLKKLFDSLTGYNQKEVIDKDLVKLVEVSSPWITHHNIQAELWLKVDKDIDINNVVKKLEELGKSK